MKLRTIFLLLLALLLLPFNASPVASQNQISAAAQRCSLAQDYFKNVLKPRDLRTRVNRLRAYQHTEQRINAFTRRLERNNQPQASEMRASLDQLGKQIDSFKASYEQYDAARESVVSVPRCRENLARFQDRLAAAREKRLLVHQDVIAIQAVLGTDIPAHLEMIRGALRPDAQEGVSE